MNSPAIAEQVPRLALIGVDALGVLQHASASFLDWFGLAADEHRPPTPVRDLFTADSARRLDEAVGRAQRHPGVEHVVVVEARRREVGAPSWFRLGLTSWPDESEAGHWVATVGAESEGADRDVGFVALQEHHRFAEEASGSGSWEMNLATQAIFWSDGMYRLYGLDPKCEPPTLEAYIQRVHPADRAQFERGWTEGIEGRRPLFSRYRLCMPDGGVRWIDVFGRATHDAEGRAILVSGLCVDTTRANQLQQDLHRAEERWKFALEGAAQGVWDWDLELGAMTYSQRFADILGHSIEELTPSPAAALGRIHPEDVTRASKALQDHIDGAAGLFHTEHRVRHAQGHWIWVEVRGIITERSATRQPTRIIGTYTDITERKSSEEALRRHAERQAFLVKLSDRLHAVSESDEVLYEAARMLGQALGAARVGHAEDAGDGLHLIVRAHYCDVVGPLEGRHRFDDLGSDAAQRLRGGQTLVRHDIQGDPALSSDQRRVQRLQGIGASVHVPLLKDERLRGIVFVHWRHARAVSSEDIDLIDEVAHRTWADLERVRAESKLAQQNLALTQAKEEAERANLAKSRFLANVSHEIRTPLNGVVGYVHLLRSTPLSAGQQHMLQRLDESASHLLEVINSVLDLSKIEAGRYELSLGRLSIRQIVDKASSIVGVLTAPKGLELRTTVDLQRDAYIGDATAIQQALLNYLGNAVKFTRQGAVRIEVTAVSTQNQHATLKFAVHDSGIGIDAEALPRLFDPFEQLDDSATRVHSGTGLGLSITKRLAALMGGEVGVHSQLGRGSTFWFTVMLVHDESLPPSSNAGANPGLAGEGRVPPSGLRVLLAEDNAINREVAVGLLDELGAQVEEAHDGAQALEMALAGDYDLILMDIQMPKLDGLEVTRRLLAARRHCPPIVAMTADAFVDGRDRFLAAGMQDVLPKPVMPDELVAVILRVMAA